MLVWLLRVREEPSGPERLSASTRTAECVGRSRGTYAVLRVSWRLGLFSCLSKRLRNGRSLDLRAMKWPFCFF